MFPTAHLLGIPPGLSVRGFAPPVKKSSLALEPSTPAGKSLSKSNSTNNPSSQP